MKRNFKLLNPILSPKHVFSNKKSGGSKDAAVDRLGGDVFESIFRGLLVCQLE